jgi:hypothetical protein
MTDPRFPEEPRFGGMWGWIAGIALLLLISLVIIAGSHYKSNTASSGSSTSTTASRTVTLPSTTGFGSSSPQTIIPAPSAPAPSKSGTQ